MTLTKDRRAAKRAKRARQRHNAEERRLLEARLRVGPDPSTREPDPDPEPPLSIRPFASYVTAYRETPEAWQDVWSEE